MPRREPLPLELGGAVARAACLLWAGPAVSAADLTISVFDIIWRRTGDVLESRRGERAFARIGEDLAERLALFTAVETGALTENERLAAIATVESVLNNAQLDAQAVIDADLSAAPIEEEMRRAGAGYISSAGLSDAGEAFFDRLLTECCNYIIEIIVSLPHFGSTATGELLRRESEIIRLIQEVLAKLPTASQGFESDAATFAIEYKRQLLRLLDWLELFGVDLSAASRRYALSAAYVSLDAGIQEVSSAEKEEETSGEEEIDAATSEDTAASRVEKVLAQRSRTLLRGEAGSGKTTLLRWLAVRAARADFTSELAAWNSLTPFVIEMRRFVGKELPTPEEFAESVAKPILANKPERWVTDLLSSGEALILVDGIDELPSAQREDARDWIRGLVAAHPRSTYILTSRPAAVSGDWLQELDFVDTELLPMSTDHIDAFIERWHKAVAQGLAGEVERSELDDLEYSLKRLVRRTPSVRNLATSPLLCAMLCGINRDRKKQLPQDRLGLYRVALESLIDRRDVERGVIADAVPSFGLAEKLLLLQDLAHWLMLNGLTSADKEQVRVRFSARLKNMHRIQATPDAVMRHMLVRSGVLREPVEGRVDFIHRTFLEYLAAAEVVEQDNIGLLVQNAHLDQWREVVILASGRASGASRERLITEMLERASRQASVRHVLQLLAVACLETAPELSRKLQDRLNEVLHGLLPPANLSDAKALASAGDLAAPLLRRDPGMYVQEAVASVRCLSLIGTDAALDSLATYGQDQRVLVSRELIRSWSSFEPDEYARRVLGPNQLDRGRIAITDPARLRCVDELAQLRRLDVLVQQRPIDFELLKGQPVSRVDVRGNDLVSDLSWLTNPRQLVYLDLERCRNLVDASELGDAQSIQVLDLSGTSALARVPDLGRLQSLRHLYVNSAPWLGNLDFMRGMPQLSALYARDNGSLENVDGFEYAAALTRLDLRGCDAIRNLDPFQHLVRLESVSLRGIGAGDLSFLASCRRLLFADISAPALQSLIGVEGLTSLVSLDLAGSRELTDVSEVAALPSLRRLDLRGTRVDDLRPLEALEDLTVMTSRPASELRVSEDSSLKIVRSPWYDTVSGELIF